MVLYPSVELGKEETGEVVETGEVGKPKDDFRLRLSALTQLADAVNIPLKTHVALAKWLTERFGMELLKWESIVVFPWGLMQRTCVSTKPGASSVSVKRRTCMSAKLVRTKPSNLNYLRT